MDYVVKDDTPRKKGKLQNISWKVELLGLKKGFLSEICKPKKHKFR